MLRKNELLNAVNQVIFEHLGDVNNRYSWGSCHRLSEKIVDKVVSMIQTQSAQAALQEKKGQV